MEEKVQRFIAKRRFAFVGSIDEDGFPNIKVMLFPRKVIDYKEFYFSTNTSSLRVQQFLRNPCACLYFCSLLSFKGVMLRGTIDVLHDQPLKEEIWKKGDTQYYSNGVTDPDYCVLRFMLAGAEWANMPGLVIVVIGLIIAVIGFFDKNVKEK